jgi:hypothetical protein
VNEYVLCNVLLLLELVYDYQKRVVVIRKENEDEEELSLKVWVLVEEIE